jgi:hypothetical protein
MYCIKCGAKNDDQASHCHQCGAPLRADLVVNQKQGTPMERRYMALRIVGTIYKVLGAMVAVITVLVILGFCATGLLGGSALGSLDTDSGVAGLLGGALGALILSIVALIYGGGLAITLYAAGEGVYLLLALEENTRTTASLLQRQSGFSSVPQTTASD